MSYFFQKQKKSGHRLQIGGSNGNDIFYFQNQKEYIWIDNILKVAEFDHFKMEAGLPTIVLSPKQWAEKTGTIRIISKSDPRKDNQNDKTRKKRHKSKNQIRTG